MTYPCSGCGLRSCDGRCFDECESDYPPEEPTCDELPITEFIRKHGFVEPLTEVRHLGPGRIAA